MTTFLAVGFPVLSAKVLLALGLICGMIFAIVYYKSYSEQFGNSARLWQAICSGSLMLIFFLLSIMTMDTPVPTSAGNEEPQICDLAWHRGIESDNVARYSRGKKMCGYLDDAASLSLELCNGVLPPGTFDPVRNCEELQSVNIAFGHWLNRTVPLAMQECDRQGIRCHSYLHSGGPIP